MTADIITQFGEPGDTDNFEYITLPYPMRIAWDTTKSVNKVLVHKKAAVSLLKVFKDLLAHYGYDRIKELEIDLFGGCYNLRQMRGGSDWSVHSWALAIDLNPSENQLRETRETATFARPEYKPMIDIFYRHGWYSLGVEKNYDWMHFQYIKP